MEAEKSTKRPHKEPTRQMQKLGPSMGKVAQSSDHDENKGIL